MITSSTLEGFTKNLPNTGFFAFVMALSFDLLMGIPALLVFVAVVSGLFFISFFGNRSRAKHTLALTGGEAPRMRVEISRIGVLVCNTGETGKEAQIPWAMISRAVDRKDRVDFYARTLFLTIPKRCIEDMDQLRKLVDQHMPPKGEKRGHRKD